MSRQAEFSVMIKPYSSIATLDKFPHLANMTTKTELILRICLVSQITHLPLTVIVNRSSASASEILAGALRDNDRAQLLGETTYGKGRIQTVHSLSDGSAVFVTVAKYFTPQMHEIDKASLRREKGHQLPS